MYSCVRVTHNMRLIYILSNFLQMAIKTFMNRNKYHQGAHGHLYHGLGAAHHVVVHNIQLSLIFSFINLPACSLSMTLHIGEDILAILSVQHLCQRISSTDYVLYFSQLHQQHGVLLLGLVQLVHLYSRGGSFSMSICSMLYFLCINLA